jgi:hypothetical protein
MALGADESPVEEEDDGELVPFPTACAGCEATRLARSLARTLILRTTLPGDDAVEEPETGAMAVAGVSFVAPLLLDPGLLLRGDDKEGCSVAAGDDDSLGISCFSSSWIWIPMAISRLVRLGSGSFP